MNKGESIAVSAPATTANLGPGFDALGGALQIRNEVVFFPGKPFSVKIYGEGSSSLPRNRENLLVRAYEETFREAGLKPVEGAFVIKNRIPLSRGLGSSAAAAVLGSYLATNFMNYSHEEKERLVISTSFKLEGHPDNVVPCYYGGIQLCVQEALSVKNFPLPVPENISVLLVVPRKKISTPKARKTLGKKVSIEQAVFNIQRACLLVWLLQNNKLDLLSLAMEDSIHQKKRLKLIEGEEAFFNKMLSHPKCMSGWLSGSGSTMAFAVRKGDEKAVEEFASSLVDKLKFEARIIITGFSEKGIRTEA